MNPQVKERLVTGITQYLSAQAAGSAQFAITDAYQAVDNIISAALLDRNIEPTKNHQEKLKRFLTHCTSVLNVANVKEQELRNLLVNWHDARYLGTKMSPNEVLYYLRLVGRLIHAIQDDIATRNNLNIDEFINELYTEVQGGLWQSYDEMTSNIHEMWQQKAELYGESGLGSKLGNKMVNPSNFCDIHVFADDSITKEILAKDQDIGNAIAKFYDDFLKLILLVQLKRSNANIKINEITNFMLSFRLRYHGQSLDEIAKDWKEIIKWATSQRDQK